MLGVDIPEARLKQARRDEQARAAHHAPQKEKSAPGASLRKGEDEFAFIAGCTEGGAPYGLTRDETEGEDVG